MTKNGSTNKERPEIENCKDNSKSIILSSVGISGYMCTSAKLSSAMIFLIISLGTSCIIIPDYTSGCSGSTFKCKLKLNILLLLFLLLTDRVNSVWEG